MEWLADERLFPLKLFAPCPKATGFDGAGVKEALSRGPSAGQLQNLSLFPFCLAASSPPLLGADTQRDCGSTTLSWSRVIDRCSLRGLTSLPGLEMGDLSGR
ncbi:hypothetical protein KUCAC02_003453, partial [Chaenocephalus aceratus]